MTFMTHEELLAAIGGHTLIEDCSLALAKAYVKEFEYGRIDEVYVNMDENVVVACVDTTQCGCCGPDITNHEIPLSYLWDDDWIQTEQQKRFEASEKARIERERELAIKKEQRREAKYQRYLTLKAEFEENG